MARQQFSSPLIDRATAVELLRGGAAEWESFLTLLESSKGRLRFRAGLSRAIKTLRVEGYPLIYERGQALGQVLVRAFMSPEQIARAEADFSAATPQERGDVAKAFGEVIEGAIAAFDFPDDSSTSLVDAVRISLVGVRVEERAPCTVNLQLLLAGGLAAFYDQLSLMVHGERITSLVAQAKAGSDEAYAKAVQIDGRVLTEIAYFRERLARARLEDDTAFLSSVWRRQVAPPYRGRIEHKSLYLMFAFLDSAGLLATFTHCELLDLYDELNLGRFGRRVQDETNMGKRLAEYRRFQMRRPKSTP